MNNKTTTILMIGFGLPWIFCSSLDPYNLKVFLSYFPDLSDEHIDVIITSVVKMENIISFFTYVFFICFFLSMCLFVVVSIENAEKISPIESNLTNNSEKQVLMNKEFKSNKEIGSQSIQDFHSIQEISYLEIVIKNIENIMEMKNLNLYLDKR